MMPDYTDADLERAREIVVGLVWDDEVANNTDWAILQWQIRIATALAAEREACAVVADKCTVARANWGTRDALAAAIRARTTHDA